MFKCIFDLYTARRTVENYPWRENVRGIGLSVSDFYFGPQQIDMFGDIEKDAKQRSLDAAIDNLRKKYGHDVIQLAEVYKDPKIRALDIKGEHTIHPYSFSDNFYTVFNK